MPALCLRCACAVPALCLRGAATLPLAPPSAGLGLSSFPSLHPLPPTPSLGHSHLREQVPSFDNGVAMDMIRAELGRPWDEIFAELSPAPIAAASLGQVYKGKLWTGEEVAVKVQRPYVLETVTVDLFIIRKLGMFLRRFPNITAVSGGF